jgi:hypothetical protein
MDRFAKNMGAEKEWMRYFKDKTASDKRVKDWGRAFAHINGDLAVVKRLTSHPKQSRAQVQPQDEEIAAGEPEIATDKCSSSSRGRGSGNRKPQIAPNAEPSTSSRTRARDQTSKAAQQVPAQPSARQRGRGNQPAEKQNPGGLKTVLPVIAQQQQSGQSTSSVSSGKRGGLKTVSQTTAPQRQKPQPPKGAKTVSKTGAPQQQPQPAKGLKSVKTILQNPAAQREKQGTPQLPALRKSERGKHPTPRLLATQGTGGTPPQPANSSRKRRSADTDKIPAPLGSSAVVRIDKLRPTVSQKSPSSSSTPRSSAATPPSTSGNSAIPITMDNVGSIIENKLATIMAKMMADNQKQLLAVVASQKSHKRQRDDSSSSDDERSSSSSDESSSSSSVDESAKKKKSKGKKSKKKRSNRSDDDASSSAKKTTKKDTKPEKKRAKKK